MCLEDIRMGRDLAAQPKLVQLSDGNPVKLCGPDPLRTRLIVSGQVTGLINLQPLGIDTSQIAGFCLTSTHPHAILRVEDWGKLLTGPWVATAIGADPLALVVECSLEKQ